MANGGEVIVEYLPPGVRHGIFNTGIEDLVFLVVASPPYDMPEVTPAFGKEASAAG